LFAEMWSRYPVLRYPLLHGCYIPIILLFKISPASYLAFSFGYLYLLRWNSCFSLLWTSTLSPTLILMQNPTFASRFG
jgi:hypothetical protein